MVGFGTDHRTKACETFTTPYRHLLCWFLIRHLLILYMLQPGCFSSADEHLFQNSKTSSILSIHLEQPSRFRKYSVFFSVVRYIIFLKKRKISSFIFTIDITLTIHIYVKLPRNYLVILKRC